MINIMSEYQELQETKFNHDFIMMKKNDPVLKHFNNIAKTLEVIDGVTYLGGEIETDESKFDYETVPKKKKRTEKEKKEDYSKVWVPTEVSRYNLITLNFRIEKEDRNYQNRDKVDENGMLKEDVSLKILFPKLIDSFYFIMNGMRKFPVFQIIDAGTYVTKTKALTLKSILMPIVIRPKSKKYDTADTDSDYKMEGKIFTLDLFRHKTNILQYFYAKFNGPDGALDYLLSRHPDLGKLDREDYLYFHRDKLTKKEIQEDELNHYFKINNKLYIVVNKEALEEYGYLRNIVATVIDSLVNKKIRNDDDYWMKSLGRVFSKSPNSQVEKAEKILVSLERLMDDSTKSNLRYDPEDKEDTYAVLRWMMLKEDKLSVMDNMSLYNKRLRFNEYLINPLLIKFSTNTYRALNTSSITFRQIMDLFKNISPYFLVNSIRNEDLIRHDSTVNTIDLFTSGLKFSFKGPQSFAQNSYAVETKYRGLHGSYVGRLGLVSSSNGDPGMTGCFSPFIEMDEDDPFYFVDRETYKNQFE